MLQSPRKLARRYRRAGALASKLEGSHSIPTGIKFKQQLLVMVVAAGGRFLREYGRPQRGPLPLVRQRTMGVGYRIAADGGVRPHQLQWGGPRCPRCPPPYFHFEGRLGRLRVLRALLRGALGILGENPSKMRRCPLQISIKWALLPQDAQDAQDAPRKLTGPR